MKSTQHQNNHRLIGITIGIFGIALAMIIVILVFAKENRPDTNSDFVTIETFVDHIPSTLSLHDGYGYLRIVLSYERCEELSEIAAETKNGLLVGPNGDIVDQESQSTIRLSHADIETLLKTLDQNLDCWAIAPVKKIPYAQLNVPNLPTNDSKYVVYILMTPNDTQRFIKNLSARESRKASFGLHLSLEDDDFAEIFINMDSLEYTATELEKTGYSFIAFPVFLSK